MNAVWSQRVVELLEAIADIDTPEFGLAPASEVIAMRAIEPLQAEARDLLEERRRAMMLEPREGM